MRSRRIVLYSAALLLLGMTSLRAQGLVTQPFPRPYPTVSFQYQHPEFKSSRGIQAVSGAVEFGGSYPVTENIIISGRLPLGMFSFDDRLRLALGNIGLSLTGGLFSDEKTALAGSLLLSLKTSPSVDENPCHCSDAEFASFVGWYADPYQSQRFTQRHWMIGGNFQARYKHSAAITLGAEVGPQWYIPTHEADRSLLVYNTGAFVNAGLQRIRGVVEYVASSTTLSDQPFGPFVYEDMIGFGVQVVSRGPDLTFYYQVMIDSHLRETVNGSYGFRLIWPLGEKEDE
ncbi:hypothetical protein C3F09_01315 [candidate division GN15 bacterium]|uniref:Transporter n=1 Tax=candidate division GN15 bacterium TaxID=2072418 RepID=A0A855X543_9BACT|nr:MAG: hypothetical protein C3F09_01315 [candidate division GN15 bacterium]